MYVVSEYATYVVVTFTLSAFLLAISVVVLTIKDRLESRRGMSRAFQKADTLFGPLPAAVVVRHKRSGR
jgi:ABC-type sulfate transport system permease subunit